VKNPIPLVTEPPVPDPGNPAPVGLPNIVLDFNGVTYQASILEFHALVQLAQLADDAVRARTILKDLASDVLRQIISPTTP
jgi:hypothetical protein